MIEQKPLPVPEPEHSKEFYSRIEQAVKDSTNNQSDYLNMDIEKAVIDKATHPDLLESTTQLTEEKIEILSNAMVLYYYTRNKAILIKVITVLRMYRSLTEKPRSLLEHMFSLASRQTDSLHGMNEEKFLDRMRNRFTQKR